MFKSGPRIGGVWFKAFGAYCSDADRLTRQVEDELRTNQIRRLPRLAGHLKEHLELLLDQLDPVAQRGCMALVLAADLHLISALLRTVAVVSASNAAEARKTWVTER